ncbi:hypothetical protein [Candidatus Poriferisodalis sp.]|uniref:hypothetical protein n=1 Tax=Candidatus Poriferisodalis sp. TaxID=3101277 RepID=UPI003D0C58C8
MRRDVVAATLGIGALVGVLTVHLLVSSSAGGPVAVPDVPAYLSIAQWLGSNGLAPENLAFQPGFGLLLAPLVWVAQISELPTQGESVHYIALVANSMAATAAVAVAGWLGWRMSGRWWVCAAGAAIAAMHPSLSSASRIAWSETLLVLALLAIAVAIARAGLAATSRSSQRSWAVAGLVATLAVALHARAVVLVVAVVVTAAVTRTGRRTWLGLAAGLLVGGGTTALALSLTGTWPIARLSDAAELDRGWQTVATVSGQLLALGGGTVGLGLVGLSIGMVAAVRLLRGRGAPESPVAAVAVFVSVGALAVVLLGGWTLVGSDRVDTVLYGRYVDPWAVPLAVVALAWISTQRSRRHTHMLITAAALALAAYAAVLGVPGMLNGEPRRIMTLSLSPAWSLADGRLAAVASAAVVLTFAGIALMAVALRQPNAATDPESQPEPPQARRSDLSRTRMLPCAAVVAAVLTLASAATVSNHRHLAGVGDIARDQVTAAAEVADVFRAGGLSCLAHDRTMVPSYAMWLYRMELPSIRHERVSLTSGRTSCSEFVIAHDGLDERCTNARHLVDEPAGAWALWFLPDRRCALPAA